MVEGEALKLYQEEKQTFGIDGDVGQARMDDTTSKLARFALQVRPPFGSEWKNCITVN